MELHHLGLDPDAVPAAAVIVTSGLAHHVSDQLGGATAVRRREFTSGRLRTLPDVLVCAGPLGSPSTIIALEELRRAGARTIVLITGCRCRGCHEGDPRHDLIVPRGAIRDEGTSPSYAPPGFPAVPDHRLRIRLADAVEHCAAPRVAGTAVGSEVVRTVDVPPAWHWPPADREEDAGPVDLESAAVFVTGAATKTATASVVVGAGTTGAMDERVRQLLAAAATAALAQAAGVS